MSNKPDIRLATPADAEELLAIYTPYVLTTAVTFELEAPSLNDFAGRVIRTLQEYPYLVAERDGQIVGYAYASAFRPRAAYRHAAETSIYVRMNAKGGGIGRTLYEALERACALQGICNLEACIASATPPDQYVPADSRLFHERLGYSLAGTFKQCAYKFDTWYDMIWMEKHIAAHPDAPQPFTPLPDVDPTLIAAALR